MVKPKAQIIVCLLNEAIDRGETLDNAGRIAAFKCNQECKCGFKYVDFQDYGNGHIMFMFDNPQMVVSVDLDRATTVRIKKH